MKNFIITLIICLIFCCRLSAQTYKWALQVGGSDYDSGQDIATDSSGNVYLLGIFNSTADFDPGPSVFNLTSAGAQDFYITKLDSNGNFTWALRIGGSAQDFAYSLVMGKDGALYVCGKFRVTVDFDPGAGTNNMISAGGSDIFILKLDTAGNFIWARQIGSGGDDEVEKIISDQAGNILICGVYAGTVDFDPGSGVSNLTSTGGQDAFIASYDTSGSLLWKGGFGNNPGELIYGLSTDASRAVYATGLFYGTSDFDPGPGVYTMTASGSYSSVFVLRWDSTGAFSWAVNMGNGTQGIQGRELETDAAGNPVVTGTFNGSVDFDPGPGNTTLTANGSNGDVFVVKLASANGAFLFAKGFGGPTLDQSYGLALDAAGNIFLSGFFSGTADFDPDTGSFYLTGAGPADAFIAKLSATGSFVWAYGFGGFDNDFSTGLHFFNNSDLYCTGVFAYTADFNPGLPVTTLSSFSNSSDAFLVKLKFCTPEQDTVYVDLCPGDSVFAGGAYHHLPGYYYDYYTASSGCDSILTTRIDYTFTLNIGPDTSFCDGQSVLLYAGVPGGNYLWSNGATTQQLLVSAAGMWIVTVTKNGCSLRDTVISSLLPVPAIQLGNDTLICINTPVTFVAGSGNYSYLWQDGSTTSSYSFGGSMVADTILIWVLAQDTNSCSKSDTLQLIISLCSGIQNPDMYSIRVTPNPFSERFSIRSMNLSGSIPIQVVDLYGQELFRSDAKEETVWINSEKWPSGIYLLRAGKKYYKLVKTQ